MAIGQLLGALERDGDAEIAAIEAATGAEVARILAESAARRDAGAEAALAAHRAAATARADAEVAGHARACARAVLVARATMLDRVRGAVTARLPALAAGPLCDGLLAAVTEAAGGEPVQLRASPAVAAALADRGVTAAPDPTVGAGIVGELAGGRVTIDATLDGLLDRMWPHLRIAAVEAAR